MSAIETRDVRSGGRWSRRQRWKNDAIYVALRVLLMIADRAPARWLVRFGRLLGDALGRFHARSREALAWAGENLALTLLLRRSELRALELVDVDRQASFLLADTLSEGRGAIVVSAHLGPFELLPAAVAELGHRPAIVVRESYDPRLDPLVDAHRLRRGITVIHRGRAGAAARMLRALRRGQPLGLLPDLPARVERLPVRLLGRAAELAVGPARLARLTGAPLLVATVARPPGARRPQLRVRRLPCEPHEDEARIAQRIADELSRAILESPTEWLGALGQASPRRSSGARSLEPGANSR